MVKIAESARKQIFRDWRVPVSQTYLSLLYEGKTEAAISILRENRLWLISESSAIPAIPEYKDAAVFEVSDSMEKAILAEENFEKGELIVNFDCQDCGGMAQYYEIPEKSMEFFPKYCLSCIEKRNPELAKLRKINVELIIGARINEFSKLHSKVGIRGNPNAVSRENNGRTLSEKARNLEAALMERLKSGMK